MSRNVHKNVRSSFGFLSYTENLSFIFFCRDTVSIIVFLGQKSLLCLNTFLIVGALSIRSVYVQRI